MRPLAILVIVYGFINIAGGIIGYTKAGSIYSLLVGGIAGLIAVWAGWSTKSKPAMGFRIAGMLCLVLLAFWIYRITEVNAQGKSPTIAIMNCGLSAGVFLILAWSHFSAISKRKSES